MRNYLRSRTKATGETWGPTQHHESRPIVINQACRQGDLAEAAESFIGEAWNMYFDPRERLYCT
jgi:hypothetical protein